MDFKGRRGEKALSSYPEEIVSIFEKHNFIWRGKWGHLDILHFEYRPEILIKARYFGIHNSYDEEWYKGIPYEFNDYVELIENSI